MGISTDQMVRNLPPKELTENVDWLGILDSFDILQIISALNDEFDISIPASEIIPENFNSAESLWDMVQRLQED